MIFFLNHGFRVIAHDRRGPGGRPRRPTVTTWITMPMISQPLSSISTLKALFEMPCDEFERVVGPSFAGLADQLRPGCIEIDTAVDLFQREHE